MTMPLDDRGIAHGSSYDLSRWNGYSHNPCDTLKVTARPLRLPPSETEHRHHYKKHEGGPPRALSGTKEHATMKYELSRIVGRLACVPLLLGSVCVSAAPVLTSSWPTLNKVQYQAETFAEEVEEVQPLELQKETNWDTPVLHADCTCCGVGCDLCCPPCRFWYAGVEAVFLAPNFRHTNISFAATDLVANTTETFNNDVGTVENQLYASPRLWVGFQGPRWGLAGRYWELQASELAFGALSAGSGSILQDRIDAYTLDLEVVRRFCRRNWRWDLGFGVRHAAFDHDTVMSSLSILAAGGGGADLISTQFAGSQFNGTGLTLGLGGRRPIRCGCASTLNLFWTLRGSILWGNVDNWAEQTATVSTAGGTITVSELAESTLEDDMFIGELQVGVQWEYCLQCLPATAFFRTAFEYQGWDANGGIAQMDTFVTDGFSVESLSTTYSSNAVMDLVGFAIGTGFTW